MDVFSEAVLWEKIRAESAVRASAEARSPMLETLGPQSQLWSIDPATRAGKILVENWETQEVLNRDLSVKARFREAFLSQVDVWLIL